MALNRRKLRDFIELRLTQLPLADRFVLVHEGRFGPNEVCVLDFDPKLPEEDAPSSLERLVSETVEEHVDGFPGRQQYFVRAFAGDTPRGEFAFGETASFSSRVGQALTQDTPEMDRLSHASAYGGGGGAAAGLAPLTHAHAQIVAQQMRHNEALTRGIVELSTRQSERDAEIIAGLQRNLARHEDRAAEMIQLREEMLSDEQVRRLQDLKFERDDQRKERLTKRLEGLLPHIFRRLGVPASVAGHITGGSQKAETKSGEADAHEGPDPVGGLVTRLRDYFMGLPPQVQDEVMDALTDDHAPELLNIIRELGQIEQEQAAGETKH